MASLDELTSPYPPAPDLTPADVLRAAERLKTGQPVFVVLDDDPTGTQSVAEVPVLMSWRVEDLRWALGQGDPAVYVMTNSRSLSPQDAESVTRDVVRAALEASRRTGVRVAFVSRSDSTLRGHFPLEPEVIADELGAVGLEVDGTVLVPAFPEAGRVTVGGTHYARVGDELLACGDTEFARDATFGYSSSDLARWVEEKTGGRVPAREVVVVGLEVVRGPLPALVRALLDARDGAVIALDAACEEDLLAISIALVEAEACGRSFVYRVGPPFMRARIGQERRPPLTGEQVERVRDARLGAPTTAAGGLVVVGSHVGLTTRQLARLVECTAAPELELEVSQVLDVGQRDRHLDDLVAQVSQSLAEGLVILRTSRALVTGEGGQDSLRVSREVSAALSGVVRRVVDRVLPRFVVAKGGITSSDIAARGLSIRRARCLGSMLPGLVSLWMAQDGPAAGVPYAVFPGNVGHDDALAEVVRTLRGAAGTS